MMKPWKVLLLICGLGLVVMVSLIPVGLKNRVIAIILIPAIVGGVAALLSLLVLDRRRAQVRALAGTHLSVEAAFSAARDAARVDGEFVQKVLEGAARQVTSEQGVNLSSVRANIFEFDPSENQLRMLFAFHIAEGDRETGLVFQPGEGATGLASVRGRPVVAVIDDVLDDRRVWSIEDRLRINPRLKWVVSVPVLIPTGEGPGGEGRSIPVWTLNVDGLEQRDSSELSNSVPSLVYWAELLSFAIRRQALLSRGKTKKEERSESH